MDLGRLTLPQRVSACAILVVVLGAFLPWASRWGFTKLGIEGDGIITLALAVAGGIVLLRTTGVVGAARTPGRASQISLVVLAAITALSGVIDMSGVAAIGLDLTLFGGIAWLVGAVWQLNLPKTDTLDTEAV